MLNDKITIIIPTKNEERGVGDIIEKCQKYADEVIVIDGHSTDKTREIAESRGVAVHLDNKKGKGDGIRVGITKATKDIIVFIDADYSHDADDIPRLVQPILDGEADHVSGSRMKGGSDELHGDFQKFARMVALINKPIGILEPWFPCTLLDTQ